jgi:hypothetical protein
MTDRSATNGRLHPHLGVVGAMQWPHCSRLLRSPGISTPPAPALGLLPGMPVGLHAAAAVAAAFHMQSGCRICHAVLNHGQLIRSCHACAAPSRRQPPQVSRQPGCQGCLAATTAGSKAAEAPARHPASGGQPGSQADPQAGPQAARQLAAAATARKLTGMHPQSNGTVRPHVQFSSKLWQQWHTTGAGRGLGSDPPPFLHPTHMVHINSGICFASNTFWGRPT